jgi:hypothetical protein
MLPNTHSLFKGDEDPLKNAEAAPRESLLAYHEIAINAFIGFMQRGDPRVANYCYQHVFDYLSLEANRSDLEPDFIASSAQQLTKYYAPRILTLLERRVSRNLVLAFSKTLGTLEELGADVAPYKTRFMKTLSQHGKQNGPAK